MQSLRKLLPNKTLRRFVHTADFPWNEDPPVEPVLKQVGESPEAYRGLHLGLCTAEMIIEGQRRGAQDMKLGDMARALGMAEMALSHLRVCLAEHPYTQEALALLEGRVPDDIPGNEDD